MTPSQTTTIRPAEHGDAPAIAEVLAAAFLHGDLAAWLVPDVDTRARIYLPYFALLTEQALDYGQVEVSSDPDAGVTAVAIWYPIPAVSPPTPAGYPTRLAQITGEYLHRFTALDAATHRHHPYDTWHHYLSHLAVHPDCHGQGLGTSLLSHHHTELDHTGTPAYLEATGERNRRLYARLGYQPRSPYRLTPTGPSLFPMWRPASPASTYEPGRGVPQRLDAHPAVRDMP